MRGKKTKGRRGTSQRVKYNSEEERAQSLFLPSRALALLALLLPTNSSLCFEMEETGFFQGPEASPRPPSAAESLPALHPLERGIVATGEASAVDLATSGRRHSSLDSARSTVTNKGSMQQVRSSPPWGERGRV